MLNKFLTGIAGVALAVTFVAAGLGVCCLPVTTEVLARMYAGIDNPGTVFTHEELVAAANAGRDYTVGSHSKEALYAAIYGINASAQEADRMGTNRLDLDAWAEAADEAAADGATNGLPATDDMEALFDDASEDYVLNTEAVDHLDDVNAVIRVAGVELTLLAVVGVCCLIAVGVRVGKRRVGGVLLGAGVGVVALFAVLGVWAVIDFYGFFNRFHSLFFSGGSWLFSADSLLITMYPTPFWTGMGVVWLAVTCLLCLLSVVVGAKLRRKKGRR